MGFEAPAAHTEPASSPWFAWDLSPTSPEAAVPPGNPRRKGQCNLPNVHQDPTQTCLICRLLPGVQDFDSCGAVRRRKGRSGGFYWDPPISFPTSFSTSLLVVLKSGLSGLLRSLSETNAGWWAAAVAAGKVWRMLQVSGSVSSPERSGRDSRGHLAACFFSHTSAVFWFQSRRLRSESQVLCVCLY